MEVARLDQAVSQLPNPDILVRPIIRREAVSTSALEGTYVAFDEVLESDFIEEKLLSVEQREVRNYIVATELAVSLLNTYPISRPLIGRIQRVIVRGTSGNTYDAGDLRQRQVCIGAIGKPIEHARFVPPPPGETLAEGFSAWEKWVNAESQIPLIVRLALTHYQFETLHPFADGNGRLGRLISILQLVSEKVLRLPVLNISPWLEQNRQSYLDGLLEVTRTGDYNPWIEFFSRAIEVQAKEGIEQIHNLLEVKEEIVDNLRKAGMRGSGLQIAENLIGYPFIDVPTAKRLIDKSFEAANNAVARLVELNVLREVTGRRQNRLYACDQVMRVITRYH
jgi:Fic family protein